MLRVLTTLFRILCDYIVLKGFEYVPYPVSNRINLGIAHSFFEKSDRDYALRCIENLQNTSSPSADTSKLMALCIRQLGDQNGNDERNIS